jgi:L-ascorbate metabolism protein UlaG (beta-lactamase superfamily)
MANVSLTWLGHAGFRLDGSSGKRVYIDPWLDNPKFPESERNIERIDVLALTHGHSDHVGSAVELCKQHSPAVACMVEIGDWLTMQGVETDGFNKGGTVDFDGVKVTLTDARHSSSLPGGLERMQASRPASSSSSTARASTTPATRVSSATCS